MGVRPEMRKYAKVAWTFLNAAGYINFGVAPAMSERIFKTPAKRGTIIVIGAGLAGVRPFPSSLRSSIDSALRKPSRYR